MKRKNTIAIICGILGCLCFGGGDWLMMYGDTTYSGNLYWLTNGVADIAAWRNSLAMLLAFPGIILYGIALFSIAGYFKAEKHKKIYRTMTAFSLTPWLCLHIFYIIILYAFSFMMNNGYSDAALLVCEAAFEHLSWVVMLSEAFMLPPFVYIFYLAIRNKIVFSKWFAFANPLIIYAILYAVKSIMPDSPFRIGFTNGLMSESMIIWFGLMLTQVKRSKQSNV